MAAVASFIAQPRTPVLSFANADGTAFKTFLVAGSLGSRLDAIFGSTSDAANAVVLQFAVQVSGFDYVLGESAVPAGAGTNGSTRSAALLNPVDIPGLSYTESGALHLGAGASLRVRPKTAIAGSNVLHLIGAAGDY